MTRLAAIFLSSLLLAACGGEPRVTGLYNIDQQHYSKHMAKVLVDSGKIPAQMQSQVEQMLQSTVFDLKLYADKSFAVEQIQGPERHSYKGTWSLIGTSFELNQTHQDEKPLTDKLSGTLIGDVIEVTGMDQDTKHKYTMKLNRSASLATPPN